MTCLQLLHKCWLFWAATKGQGAVLQEEAAKQAEDSRSGEGNTEAPVGPSAEQREREEEEVRQKREAEFDEQIRARAVRADLLGQDRHCRRYWWLQGEVQGLGLSLTLDPRKCKQMN